MSTPVSPTLVRPFVALLYNSELIDLKNILVELERLWPPFQIEFKTSPQVFSLNNYYSKEMGEEGLLRRVWVSFDQLIGREELVRLKVQSNEREKLLQKKNIGRLVNIDPGYVALEQMVLATGKPYGHRLFLGEYQEIGIYGELTYIFEKKRWKPLPWTYPDYCTEDVKDFFLRCRKALYRDLKEL